MLDAVFMGTPGFAVPALDALAGMRGDLAVRICAVYTQPDRPVGRGLEVRPCPVKMRALELGLQVFQPEKLTAPGEFEKLSALKPDVIIVVAYGQILRRNVIELPRLGCVNLHSSLLPRWRGAAPIQAAILAGDKESGVTTMRIIEKLDAGDILLQEKTPLAADETAGSLHDRLAAMGAALLVKTVRGLSDGALPAHTQEESLATCAPKLTKEMEWLDPSRPVAELYRKIRALDPWPGTSVWVEGEGRLKIRGAVPCAGVPVRPGRIFDHAGVIVLGAADGGIEILKAQWDGGKAVGPAEFLNGLRGRGKKLPLGLKPGPQ